MLQCKAIRIAYSECVPVALGFPHEIHMRRIVVCGLPGPTIFLTFIP
jgi:hypothetical protein